MFRALQLARCGGGRVSPNPMVGAVIVYNDTIIGEGFHANYGGPHAEVNAINSVKEENRLLLKDSSIYVTLEPCAHFGKTPPCANLIVRERIPRVIIGSLDPNPKVAGKGIEILQQAGIEVVSGVLEKECAQLNKRFMHFHTHRKPWIMLKWAQSYDGFMAKLDAHGNAEPVKISNNISSIWVHKERSLVDAITVGSNTLKIDNPKLNVRFWGGNSPFKIDITRHIDCREFIEELALKGITSVMVEGGPTLLKSFINDGLYDEIRVEFSPKKIHRGLEAPSLPKNIKIAEIKHLRDNTIITFRR